MLSVCDIPIKESPTNGAGHRYYRDFKRIGISRDDVVVGRRMLVSCCDLRRALDLLYLFDGNLISKPNQAPSGIAKADFTEKGYI